MGYGRTRIYRERERRGGGQPEGKEEYRQRTPGRSKLIK